VNLPDSLAARRAAVGNASLAILFLIVHTYEVWNFAYQGRAWLFDCVVGLVVCGVALARELSRLLAAAAGLAIVAAASVIAAALHLPAEPGVAATIALIVLVASAVRASPVVPAAAVAVAGAVLTAMMAVFHLGPLVLWWGCAMTGGLLLRRFDTRRRLTSLIGRFARRGTPVRLQVPDGLTWPPELTATICRVIREGLASATRHAALATAVTVTITCDQETVTVEVADDAPAIGDRTPVSGGHGLGRIRERVEKLGGTYRTGTPPGCGGWSVRATVPVAAN